MSLARLPISPSEHAVRAVEKRRGSPRSRRRRGLSPLVAQILDLRPELTPAIEAARVASDQLVDPRQDHPAGPQSLDANNVAGMKAGGTKLARRDRYLVLAAHLRRASSALGTRAELVALYAFCHR